MPITRSGLVRVHGPVTNCCPGSRNPPLTCTPLQDTPTPDVARALSLPRLFAKILKRIPRASRDLSARKLANILDRVTMDNSESSWDRLFCFAPRCLRVPDRGGHQRSLASHVNSLIKRRIRPNPQPPAPVRPKTRPTRDPLETLAARVHAKLEDGDFKGALRLASSEDSIAKPNSGPLSALQEKHLQPHPESAIPSAPTKEQAEPIQVSEEEVAKAICSFPCGSAGGPDGLRPQHLKDMTGNSADGGGPVLLRSLTSFINLILRGEAAPFVRPSLFGATLIAIARKVAG